jgi:hypothetical protein
MILKKPEVENLGVILPFITGVHDTGDNLSPVTTTPANISANFHKNSEWSQ